MKSFEIACAHHSEQPVSSIAAAVPSSPEIFWHRQLPPLDAVALAEHTMEATSTRVPGTLANRSRLWTYCYRDLMEQAAARLRQEVNRLGGRYAHVLEESVTSRRDDRAGESWLVGRFRYVLLR